jgi:hypothetical protein
MISKMLERFEPAWSPVENRIASSVAAELRCI